MAPGLNSAAATTEGAAAADASSQAERSVDMILSLLL